MTAYKNKTFKVSDLLCGLGGATQGVHASDYATVVEGLNHSPHAIAINKANHPEVHFHIADLYSHVGLKKCDFVIAGIECTNHSNAKGGESRDADSRAMANEMFRYSRETECKVMILENVREFKDWGPVIKKRDKNGVIMKQRKGKNKGKPIMIPDPDKKGRFFATWKYKMINECGFSNYSERMICAADFGAATTRTRYFMVFAKDDWKIEWPEATHSKEGSAGLFGLKKWVPCSKFIDLDNHGNSIFGRLNSKGEPKPLVANTHERIAYGIKKYGLNDKHFIAKYYGNGHNITDIKEPLHTITTKDRHLMLSTEQFYVQHYHGAHTVGGIENPLRTIVTKDEKAFITMEKVQFIDKYFKGKTNVSSLADPLHTILTQQKMSLTSMDLIISEFNRPSAVRSTEDPLATLTTFQGKRKINVQFMASSYTRNTPTVRNISDPLRTITTFQSPQLVTAELIQFASTYFDQDIVQLLHTEEGLPIGVHIGKGIFLTDVKMRWLNTRELASCQGFPEDYILIGSKKEQVKGIGNSISPKPCTAIIDSISIANENKLLL